MEKYPYYNPLEMVKYMKELTGDLLKFPKGTYSVRRGDDHPNEVYFEYPPKFNDGSNVFNIANKFKIHLMFNVKYINPNSIIAVKEDYYKSLPHKDHVEIFRSDKKYSWVFEKYDNKEKYIQMERFELNKKFYYKNMNTNQIITNFYMGWGNENILY